MTELQQILAKLTVVQAALTEVHAELTKVQAEQKVADRFTALETEVKSHKKVFKQMKVKYYWCSNSDPTVNKPERISSFFTDVPSSLKELTDTLHDYCSFRLCWKDSEDEYIDLIDDKNMRLAFDECKKIGVIKMYGQRFAQPRD